MSLQHHTTTTSSRVAYNPFEMVIYHGVCVYVWWLENETSHPKKPFRTIYMSVCRRTRVGLDARFIIIISVSFGRLAYSIRALSFNVPISQLCCSHATRWSQTAHIRNTAQSIASHNECSSRAGWKTGWKNNSRDGGAMHGKIVMIHCTDYTFRRIHTITTTATTTTTKKISHILISHTFSFSIDDEHCMSV